MYDLYKNPPKTKQDIRDYLISWLQKVDDKTPLIINGEAFVRESGFRRAFHSHTIFRSVVTNEYIWWVFEIPDLDMFPKKRYSTYEALLEDVVNEYYIAWKLYY